MRQAAKRAPLSIRPVINLVTWRIRGRQICEIGQYLAGNVVRPQRSYMLRTKRCFMRYHQVVGKWTLWGRAMMCGSLRVDDSVDVHHS